MADLAISRVQLIDNSRRRLDGKRIHRLLPWQIVTYPDAAPMLEPVDCLTGRETSFATTKQITGVLFCEEDQFVAQNGTGGQVGMFRDTVPWD